MGTVPYASASDGETSVQLRGTEFFALTPSSVLYVAYTFDGTLFPATGGWGDGFILGFDNATGALSRFIGQPGGDFGSFAPTAPARELRHHHSLLWPNTDPSLDTGGPAAATIAT
jgi:hypothetical protein